MSSSSAAYEPSESCPYWRKGYCVADRACKLRHDPSEGGHFQAVYVAQSGNSNTMMSCYSVNPSQLASAVYGGHIPMSYGYGYYTPIHHASAPEEPVGPPKNYKTIQCRHFLRGHCLRGIACGFRHGDEEPTEDQSAAFGQLPAELSNPIHPGRLFRVNTCRRWVQGTCNMGDRCTFRHDFEGADSTVHHYCGVKRGLSPDRETTAPLSRTESVTTTPALVEEPKSPVNRDAIKFQKT